MIPGKDVVLWGSSRAFACHSMEAGVDRRPRRFVSSLSTRSLYNVPRALKFGAGVLHFVPGSCHLHSQKIASVRQQPRKMDKSHLLSYRTRHGYSWETISPAGLSVSQGMLCYAVRSLLVMWGAKSGQGYSSSSLEPFWVTPSSQNLPHGLRDMSQGVGRGLRREGAFRTTQASWCEDA